MLDTDLLNSIAREMMANNTAMEVHSKSVPIRRTSSQHLKTMTHSYFPRSVANSESRART